MVKLTPDQQQGFVDEFPAAFAPASGAWGRQGCTTVLLDSVDKTMLEEAVKLAWRNTIRKPLSAKTSKDHLGLSLPNGCADISKIFPSDR